MKKNSVPGITMQQATDRLKEFSIRLNNKNKMNKTVSINGRKAQINLEDGFLSINFRGHEMNLELNEFQDISDIVNLMANRPEFPKEREEKTSEVLKMRNPPPPPVKAETIINKIVDDMNNSNYETELENELRDEFAKAAMQGELAAQNFVTGEHWANEINLSKRAYMIANAMLEERKKHIKKG